MYGRGGKKQEDDKDDHGDQRGRRGAIEGEQGVRSATEIHLCNGKTRKQTRSQNETAKQGHTSMSIKATKLQKNNDTK